LPWLTSAGGIHFRQIEEIARRTKQSKRFAAIGEGGNLKGRFLVLLGAPCARRNVNFAEKQLEEGHE
jgi:hypothetical protein